MTNSRPSLCVKVDVDTLDGYIKGVPRLLEILDGFDVRATFCVPTGPDHSGRAIRRLFTRRGFLSKMLRTRAVAMYGLRTMLYGTLLPGPMIIAARPQLLGEITTAGHELIPHGWDHVGWQELARACRQMEMYTGNPCHAFAAPGWQATPNSISVQQELRLRYASDTRGWCPFFPMVGDRTFEVMQIPTTLPTLDELIGRPNLEGTDLTQHMLGLIRRPPGQDVLTIHAEVEGRAWAEWFAGLLQKLAAEGLEFITLADLHQRIMLEGNAVSSEMVLAELPGRAGPVACQASVPLSG
jgi:peptidoglycan/xylan/chitin deacetylase (PgdA/CDA1 family)